MKYVVDASVGFKWVVLEALSDKAQLLRDDYRNGIHELLAPDFFPLEVAHALTRAERQNRLTAPQGGILWADVMTTCPQLFPAIPHVPRAYDIASKARIGIYDCLYVALAEREKCELVTADDKLVKTLQQGFPFIRHLSTLP
ncbi:MAG: type II toxin-antitoxin system VapC family toxin [Gemmataceae bacterium]